MLAVVRQHGLPVGSADESGHLSDRPTGPKPLILAELNQAHDRGGAFAGAQASGK